jgi:hypothetical protein
MSYQRVIPRDLFNEANLLKCYGQVYLQLEKLGMEHCLIHGPKRTFMVEQSIDGELHINNVRLIVGGHWYHMWRPLNSREPYPLYITPEDGDDIEVFNDDGTFTEEMKSLLLNA